MTTIEQKLSARIDKEDTIALINQGADEFDAAIALALCDEHPMSWRAAWLLDHATVADDSRIVPHLSALIGAIEDKPDGQQRGLIMLTSKMTLDEDQEGRLFDVCMTIWEDGKKIPSVRAKAFGFIASVAKKYPEMLEDIEHLTRIEYTHTLSHGVRHSIDLIKKKLFKE